MDVEKNSMPDAELFDSIETGELYDANLRFKKSVKAQFTSIDSKSNYIVFKSDIDDVQFTDDAKNIINSSNYELNSLNGENVILFRAPIFISELLCAGQVNGDKKSKAVRLITWAHSDKKFVSPHNINHGTATYKVNDTVKGIILPSSMHFARADLIDFNAFFRTEEKTSELMSAHQNLLSTYEDFFSQASEKIDKVNSILSSKASQHELLKNDLDLAMQEQRRLVKSNQDATDIVQRLTLEIDKANKELSSIQEEEADASDNLKVLKSAIQERRKDINSATEKLSDVIHEVSSAEEKLTVLKEEIRQAERDINLTTLDMKGFSAESRKQSTYFYLGASASFIALCFVFGLMYTNAESFKELMEKTMGMSAWEILLSRLPLITATTLVVGTLSALLFYLVSYVVSLNNEKMNMLKAAILAEQITGSIASDSLTEEQKIELKRNTKIELVTKVFSGNQHKELKSENQDVLYRVLENLTKKG